MTSRNVHTTLKLTLKQRLWNASVPAGIGISFQIWILPFTKYISALELKVSSTYVSQSIQQRAICICLIHCPMIASKFTEGLNICLCTQLFLDPMSNVVLKVLLTCTLIFVYLHCLILSVNDHPLSKINSTCKMNYSIRN